MNISQFSYDLPEELIAQTPIEPRNAARLLRGSDLSDWRVGDLPALLEPGDLVVVNETRVRAARLRGRRVETGGAVELLLLRPVNGRWQALVRPARRLRAGVEIDFGPLSARLETDPVDGRVEVTFDLAGGDLEDTIARVGEMPLPPYIHERLMDPDRYQTVFAERVGSAAAPTAGLHFNQATLNELAAREIELARVELQVGLDTFRPITATDILDHEMHSEYISVPEETVAQVRATRTRGGSVIAIGTTVVRALEAAATEGELRAFEGPTSLYVVPGYRFRVVDLLMTNFHISRSSLLVMVAAFVGDQWREIYSAAIERRYRFLSFGDAMLLEPS